MVSCYVRHLPVSRENRQKSANGELMESSEAHHPDWILLEERPAGRNHRGKTGKNAKKGTATSVPPGCVLLITWVKSDIR